MGLFKGLLSLHLKTCSWRPLGSMPISTSTLIRPTMLLHILNSDYFDLFVLSVFIWSAIFGQASGEVVPVVEGVCLAGLFSFTLKMLPLTGAMGQSVLGGLLLLWLVGYFVNLGLALFVKRYCLYPSVFSIVSVCANLQTVFKSRTAKSVP